MSSPPPRREPTRPPTRDMRGEGFYRFVLTTASRVSPEVAQEVRQVFEAGRRLHERNSWVSVFLDMVKECKSWVAELERRRG